MAVKLSREKRERRDRDAKIESRINKPFETTKEIEENFSDILSMLKKKVQEKDEEIVRLREENIKLKEKLTEIDPDFVLEETFKRR